MEVKMMRSVLQVVLVDINPRVIAAWRAVFANEAEVEIVHGSILSQNVDAWVTPTNAAGCMNGGVDALIKQRLGASIEERVQREIEHRHQGMMPVGCATCVPTGAAVPRFLISTPTMFQPAEDVSVTLNVADACAAAFQAIHLQNARDPGSITSVALPGLGAATGRVPAKTCANLMGTAYRLLRDGEFRDFDAMRAAVRKELGIPALLREDYQERIQVLDIGSESIRAAPWLRGY